MDRAGVQPRLAEKMLIPLLQSVVNNVARLGVPRALSGVVRRGDTPTLRRHAETLSRLTPEHMALYLASAQAQIPLARELGDIAGSVVDELESAIAGMVVAGGRDGALR
jgi:predicted short-subunit dehydrogenase-like oxidoreductase (DUF2520 family)